MQEIHEELARCDLRVEETIAPHPAGRPVDDPVPPGAVSAADPVERTARPSSFTRILLRALGAWAS